jgi:hypothetical protein
MKLQELFEKIDLSTSTPIQFGDSNWLPISGDLVGQGVQARVFSAGPGMVTKIAVLDEEMGLNDPTIKFLDLILEHQDNPFFPKIYHARVYRDKEGIKNPVLIVQMEKLIPITDPKIRDASAGLYDQLGIGTKNLSPAFKQHIKQFDKPTQTILSKTSALRDKISKAPESKDITKLGSRSKNPQFKEALKVLGPAMKKHGDDLHHGNWMVRLTGAGPQLVIVDPFTPSVSPNQ